MLLSPIYVTRIIDLHVITFLRGELTENTDSKKKNLKKRALFYRPLIEIWRFTAKNQSIREDVLAFECIKTAKDVNK